MWLRLDEGVIYVIGRRQDVPGCCNFIWENKVETNIVANTTQHALYFWLYSYTILPLIAETRI